MIQNYFSTLNDFKRLISRKKKEIKYSLYKEQTIGTISDRLFCLFHYMLYYMLIQTFHYKTHSVSKTEYLNVIRSRVVYFFVFFFVYVEVTLQSDNHNHTEANAANHLISIVR